MPISEVVITVPAFFDETRRKATQDAGRLAGLQVLDIINEPTAAAVAYGHYRGFLDLARAEPMPEDVRVLVYDLGGGTFDVTILEIKGTQFLTLATDGDVRLGGKDFDERVVNRLAERFLATHGIDPREDPQDGAQLWLDANEAKQALSEHEKTAVVCSHAGIRMRIELRRTEFEELIRDFVERTETTTSLVLKQARLEWSQIDHVLLVGGSTRIPMVRRMLRQATGKEPDCSQSPDQTVAHGAALYAAMLMDQRASPNKPGCELINVNSHSLGVVAWHPKTGVKRNAILIPKNSRLPCRAVRVFRTAEADQRNVKVPIVEGESHRPENCIFLGECIVRNLPPGLPKGAAIEVEYSYAQNGRISVSARVPSIRQGAHVDIDRDDALDLEDLEAWRVRVCGLMGVSGDGFLTLPDKSSVDPTDRASVLKRLDALYAKVGRSATGSTLPRPMSQAQEGAIRAAAELGQAQADFGKAEDERENASDSLRTSTARPISPPRLRAI